MKKQIAFTVLALACIFAIYNIKTPSQEVVINDEESLVEEVIVPTADNREVATIEASSEVVQSPSSRKVAILKEIISSRNDNDPRMDTELKNLSIEDKEALVAAYNDLKPESLNGKGTIVFLIGREMTRPEDAEFLKNVLSEEPCLSFDNCGVPNAQTDPHMDSVNNVTLNYPQIVALNRIKNYIQTRDLQTVNPSILSHLTDATKIGQSSKTGMIKNRSDEIAELLKQKN